MKITAIRSDRIYRDMMTALPDKKENIYRNQLMKPFEFKWACVGIPLTAAQEGGYDVVSAATMSGFYAPVQITEERQAEIEKISSDTFWASCEASIRNTLLDFEQHGIQLPKQEYVFTVMLSDPQSPMTAMTGDYCGDGGFPVISSALLCRMSGRSVCSLWRWHMKQITMSAGSLCNGAIILRWLT